MDCDGLKWRWKGLGCSQNGDDVRLDEGYIWDIKKHPGYVMKDFQYQAEEHKPNVSGQSEAIRYIQGLGQEIDNRMSFMLQQIFVI